MDDQLGFFVFVRTNTLNFICKGSNLKVHNSD